MALIVVAIATATSIPLYRYADRDDAPGGMVIAFLIFVIGTVFAIWIVKPASGSNGDQSQRT